MQNNMAPGGRTGIAGEALAERVKDIVNRWEPHVATGFPNIQPADAGSFPTPDTGDKKF